MNRESIEIIKSIYKPYKYTIKNSVHILDTTSGKFVLKEKKSDIRNLYNYLESRSFNNFAPLIDDSRKGVNIFSYVNDTDMPSEQKAMDLMKIVGLLHQKTTYYKDVVVDEYKKIYENLTDTINYLKYFYDNTYNEAFNYVYPSPSKYLLLTNYSKIYNAIMFSEQELEKWYQKVKDINKYRVCQVHHNLTLEHFIEGKTPTLISWDNSKKDTPVLDIYEFYKNSYFNYNFETLWHEYLKYCPWSDEEKQLFFIVISLPPKFELKGKEFDITKNVQKVLDYVYKTESLVRPYYTVEEKEK